MRFKNNNNNRKKVKQKKNNNIIVLIAHKTNCYEQQYTNQFKLQCYKNKYKCELNFYIRYIYACVLLKHNIEFIHKRNHFDCVKNNYDCLRLYIFIINKKRIIHT